MDALREELTSAGLNVPRIVAGGSGSFAVHAQRPDIECSPGTGVFWDLNYRARFSELDFLYAALLLGRVVSKPGGNRLCVDLGYKAVSPDNPHPRLALLEMRNVEVFNHSEEHLTVETPDASRFAVGDPVLAVPYHVCPTVNLYREAVVIEGGRAEALAGVGPRPAVDVLTQRSHGPSRHASLLAHEQHHAAAARDRPLLGCRCDFVDRILRRCCIADWGRGDDWRIHPGMGQ